MGGPPRLVGGPWERNAAMGTGGGVTVEEEEGVDDEKGPKGGPTEALVDGFKTDCC